MDCSTPGFPVLHHLPELDQTHVHWVSDAIQPSHPLSSSSPPAFNFSQHQGLFKWVSLSWSTGVSASASVPFNEYLGLIPSRMNWLDLLAVQGTQASSPTLQLKSINSSAFSLLYGPTLTSICDYKNKHKFDSWTFISKVMSLLLDMLSRFVIGFLPRSNHPLISCLQSLFTVFLESNHPWISCLQSLFTAILESKKIKSVTASTFPCFSFYLPWSDGTRCHDLSFWMLTFKPALSLLSITLI